MRRAAALAAFLLGLPGWSAGDRESTRETAPPGSPPAARERSSPATEVLRRACRFLWDEQGEDGAWHSETYSFLRSGQALTPFVLEALLGVGEEPWARRRDGVRRALGFIRRHVSREGIVGDSDPDLLEYPGYATALALLCLVEAGEPGDAGLVERLRRGLVSRQYRRESGFDRQAPVHGGWGFGAPRGSRPGHVDISYTRHVLEALRAAGGVDATVFARAERFLEFLQRHPADLRPQPSSLEPGVLRRTPAPYDGGFYFSPVVLAANKGGLADDPEGTPYFRSYATATCDGVLALLAAGVPGEDERLARARAWLAAHPTLERPEGIPRDTPERWAEAVHTYHLAVRAAAYQALHWPGDWRRRIAVHLAARQQADGSFVNRRGHLMKEDDPILCTVLAVNALSPGSPAGRRVPAEAAEDGG